ncbi:hypothetical protein [Derxia gummosa]|uniref:Uncharacterized protein n=1 Tax=Derxia gummosa DSM 723 TaxID=1121388 RepID=A0A8B6XBD0_9BURK|nr:hypothetical protein [Derxia gummosa]
MSRHDADPLLTAAWQQPRAVRFGRRAPIREKRPATANSVIRAGEPGGYPRPAFAPPVFRLQFRSVLKVAAPTRLRHPEFRAFRRIAQCASRRFSGNSPRNPPANIRGNCSGNPADRLAAIAPARGS